MTSILLNEDSQWQSNRDCVFKKYECVCVCARTRAHTHTHAGEWKNKSEKMHFKLVTWKKKIIDFKTGKSILLKFFLSILLYYLKVLNRHLLLSKLKP